MAQVNLLLVEDDLTIVQELITLLEKTGYNVCAVAHNATVAITQAKECQPDLVLMDIALKGEVNSIDAACQIRDRFDLPVVFLTAGSNTEIPEQIKNDDSFAEIVNPFALQNLKNSIEKVLSRSHGEAKEDYREKLRFVLDNTGKICHDLNQPMMAISGLSELLLFTMDQGDPAYEKITKIQSQVQRMSSLTQKLMGITRDESIASC